MEAPVGIRGAVCRNQQIRALIESGADRREANLHWPLAEAAPIVRVFSGFIRGGALHRAHLHAGAAAHLLLACQMFLDRFLVERGGFALHKADGAHGTRGQAVAQPVAVVVANQPCLAVHHGNRAFLARRGAKPAAGTEFFVNVDDCANHECFRLLLPLYYFQMRMRQKGKGTSRWCR